jgi:hypothetical protein
VKSQSTVAPRPLSSSTVTFPGLFRPIRDTFPVTSKFFPLYFVSAATTFASYSASSASAVTASGASFGPSSGFLSGGVARLHPSSVTHPRAFPRHVPRIVTCCPTASPASSPSLLLSKWQSTVEAGVPTSSTVILPGFSSRPIF